DWFIFSIGRVIVMMEEQLQDFFHYLQIERGLSNNTRESYQRDLHAYLHYVKKNTEKNRWEIVQRNDIMDFLYTLKDDGKSTATIARFLSSIRLFHRFLINEQRVTHDATLHIE